MSKKKVAEDIGQNEGKETKKGKAHDEEIKDETSAGENQSEQQTGSSKEDEEINARYLRLAADFQNFKRRVEKEKGDIYAYANEKIVVDLLDVIDNFERALDHSSDNNESFAEGMSMIFKQFKGVLEKNGVEEINSLGEQFDPNFHHAVMTESSEEFKSDHVIQVLQKGYMLNKKVIRPAMVKVAE